MCTMARLYFSAIMRLLVAPLARERHFCCFMPFFSNSCFDAVRTLGGTMKKERLMISSSESDDNR